MRRTALLVPLLLLPACGDGAELAVERTGKVAPTPTAEPTAAPSPSPEPVATTAPVVTPTPTSPPTRAAAPAPTALRTAAQGDVDGDGTVDEVTLDENLAVTLSGSGRTVASAFQADTSPQPSGSEDLDRDGRAEVFLRTGQGSSTSFLTPFRYDGRTLAPLTIGGEQAKLGVGGSATHGDGFSCTEQGRLVVRAARSDDGTTFTVTTTTYRVEGHRLVQTARTTDTARSGDERVGAAYLVDCRSVGEGG